ncbi:TolC family protein [Gynurincola endophyticus]|uniref:TolC family protein n=1 Tax=Gynurincola endophyticus TaxID=2479004 RepID=UPI0018F6F67F|nr:TolC family protein [Gynurincola endophyticus]
MTKLKKFFRNCKTAWMLCLAVGSTGYLSAQNTDSVVNMTLPYALQHAMEHQASVRKSRMEIETGENKIAEARSQALPQLTASGTLAYNPLLQKSALPGELIGQPGTTLLVAFGQKWNTGASLNLTQNIFDVSVFTGLKAAQTTREYYRLLNTLTEEQLIEQVATSYFQVLVQRQQMASTDSTIATTEKVKEVIEGLYKSGLAKKIDLDRTKVNLSNLYSQRQQLLNGIQLQENLLKFYIGMNVETPVSFEANELERIKPQLELTDVIPNVKTLTDFRALQKQEHLLVLNKEAAKASNYPTLSMSANFGYGGLGNTFPWFKTPSDGVNYFGYSTIGLNLRVPIFSGFYNRSKIRQADVDLRKLRVDMTNTENSLKLNFLNAKTQIENSIITLNMQKENVELAQEVYENTLNNYNQGLAPLTDLLESESSLTNAQNQYSNALLNYKLAEIALLKAQGNLKSLYK